MIKVCDVIMGGGKSTAAIRYMNETDDKFIYLSPYLDEVERIMNACPRKNFKTPEDFGGSKLNNLHKLLNQEENIASTHALFARYNEDTMKLITSTNYTLILDEVFGVLEPLKISKDDIDILFDSRLVTMADDDEHVVWVDENYTGTRYQDIKAKAQSHNLIFYKGLMMFWTFPINIFKAFKDVIVLTYLFDAQIQKYYYDIYNIEYKKIGVVRDEMGYVFTSDANAPVSPKYNLKKLVHVVEHDKLNAVGDGKTSLSASWYKRKSAIKERPMIDRIRKNLCNYFVNITTCSVDKRMWTTYKEYRSMLEDRGYVNSFVSCNARATNEYRDRTALAYCINVFFNPCLKNYFMDHGVAVKEDEYALSELVQWIWRSAVRDGNEITLYIPSCRMRAILKNWLNELAFCR